MDLAALLVAVVALVVAIKARGASGKSVALDDARADARRRVENLREEHEAELAKLREMVALLADGRDLSGEMIREGRLWSDILPTEAAALFATGDLRTIDVRSPQETAQGILPGAMLVPIDEIEARVREIPRDGKPTLVYCAGGGRSAAACEFLANSGYVGLLNLQGGFSSWPGPTGKPNPV
jgi:rhodanese-related sulfurtransferase